MTPIDAVISWVDGYDPTYQKKLASFCKEQGFTQSKVIEPTRIQQSNEIHYCLQSLERFAPWIRTIYVITNQQVPPAVIAAKGTPLGDKIKIIDQNDLLREYEVECPIFNSLSIEWLIWRIKGLSKQFLYLNDDFFIIRDVTPEDFFHNNQIILRGEWKVSSAYKFSYQIKKRISQLINKPLPKPKSNPHRAWQENSACLAGLSKKFYLLPHAPFPLLKQTFDDCIAHNPNLFKDNATYPFRHPNQLSSIPFITHLEIKHHRAIFKNDHKSIMVNGETHSFKKIKSRLLKASKSKNITFVCMQSLDQAPPETRHYMLDWIDSILLG